MRLLKFRRTAAGRNTAFLILLLLAPAVSRAEESAYARVIRTKTLRCGYAVWPGLIEKDPNSGKLRGLYVDLMEEIGRVSELEIEWTGEYGWADFIEALAARKIDAMCSGIWTNAVRGKFVLFTEPIAYQASVPVVRADDTRFDDDIRKLDDPAMKIVVTDGEAAATIAATDYPRARLHSLPQASDAGMMIANLLHRKGDATFLDLHTAKDFQSKNPGLIKIVPTAFPARIFGLTIALSPEAHSLKSALDTASKQLLWIGKVEELLLRHETVPGGFIRATLPFAGRSDADVRR